MPAPISAIGNLPAIDPLRSLNKTGATGDFEKILNGTMQQMQSVQSDAGDAVQKFLTGENEELHNTVLAVQKAEIAFDLGLQVRNKVVSAYQEIMRMQM